MSVPAAVTMPAGLTVADTDSRAIVSNTAWAGVCLWILVAPFEGTRPLLTLPGQNLSSVEAALVAVFVAWFAAAAWTRTLPQWRTTLSLPWLTCVAVTVLAAAVASDWRVNALHMAGRTVLALGVYFVTVNAIPTASRLQPLFAAAAVAGLVIAVLAVLEYLGSVAILRFLTAFRPDVAVVGAQVRAAGPFQYPTIASMYLEILFALTLALVPLALDGARRVEVVLALVALAAMAEAIILTFTRTGLLAMVSSLAIVGASRYARRGWDRATLLFCAVAALVALELVGSHSIDALRLRMTSEGQEEWYRASVEAPLALTFATGASTTVPVTLRNTGRTTWDSSDEHPYRIAYHWLLADADRAAIYEGRRTSFARPVPPGATVTIQARVQAPNQPGHYRLMWDLVQEGRLWFSTEAGASITISRADVTGPAVGPAPTTLFLPLPKATVRPGRLSLWRAAARMLIEHPLFGVGPDNFRLLYGQYAGIINADPRMHANNMYLEVLVGGGVAVGCAFAWFCWRTLALIAGLLRTSSGAAGAAIAAAVVAMGIHGLVDSFLSFTATYVLFSITLGLAVACQHLSEADAHRV